MIYTRLDARLAHGSMSANDLWRTVTADFIAAHRMRLESMGACPSEDGNARPCFPPKWRTRTRAQPNQRGRKSVAAPVGSGPSRFSANTAVTP